VSSGIRIREDVRGKWTVYQLVELRFKGPIEVPDDAKVKHLVVGEGDLCNLVRAVS
jgi:hypothetical protein